MTAVGQGVGAQGSRPSVTTRIGDLFAHIGYEEFVDAQGAVVVDLPVAEHVINHTGAIQGGLIATLIDIVAGRTAIETMEPGSVVVTSDIHVRYLRGVREGRAQALARVIHQGRRSIVLEVTVTEQPSGRTAASATANFTVVGGA